MTDPTPSEWSRELVGRLLRAESIVHYSRWFEKEDDMSIRDAARDALLEYLATLESQVETARGALEGLRNDYGSGCWCDGIRGLHDNECKAAAKALQDIEEGGDAEE